MNEETLERLMMDAALGGLSDDVEELLMAHLEGDEARRQEAEQLRVLVGRARGAIKVECPADFGELSRAEPDLRIESRIRRDKFVAWGGRIAAMAACVVMGIGIAHLRPKQPSGERIVVVEKPAGSSAVAVNSDHHADEGELWSAQRVYRNAIEANKSEKPERAPRRIFQ